MMLHGQPAIDSLHKRFQENIGCSVQNLGENMYDHQNCQKENHLLLPESIRIHRSSVEKALRYHSGQSQNDSI